MWGKEDSDYGTEQEHTYLRTLSCNISTSLSWYNYGWGGVVGVREYLFTNMHAHIHEYVRVCKISGFTPSYDALGRLLK